MTHFQTGIQMSDQFDLEQGIMGCWQVTSDLDVLFEELVENDSFTKDQASNFVLGLSTIYEAKFDKLFRTFEEFLKEYYRMRDHVKYLQEDLNHMQAELEEFQDAKYKSLADLFDEEEERLRLQDENDRLDFIEDEFSEQ